MLAYAPDNRPGGRKRSPRALLLVIAGHVALVAVVLTARGEMPAGTRFTPTDIFFIDPIKPPPPPPPAVPDPPRSEVRSLIYTPPVIVPLPQPVPQPLDRGPPVTDLAPYAGTAILPALPQPAPPAAVKKAARFITPADDVRPPYPESKRRLEEEASLRLSLTIDARGRVIAVDPVGAADPAFLDAARRHILQRWRYQPATAGGVAIDSRVVVTLRFELER